MRRVDELVAAPQQFVAQPVFHQLAYQAALGVPEDQPRPGFFLDAEKIEFRPQAAMVAPLGLFQTLQILVEFRLREEARAVDALHLRVAFLALPVGARDAHQFERLDAAGGGDVRAAAEIDEFAGGVERHHGLDGFFLDQFALEGLIPLFVQLDGFGLGQQLALVGNVRARQFVHLLFDARQVFGSERLLAQELVEKAGVDGRADAQLHVGKEFEHRGGQQVRRRMAEDLSESGSFAVRILSVVSRSSGRERSTSSPLALRDQRFTGQSVRNFLRDLAGVVPRGHLLRRPSGNVICMVSMAISREARKPYASRCFREGSRRAESRRISGPIAARTR